MQRLCSVLMLSSILVACGGGSDSGDGDSDGNNGGNNGGGEQSSSTTKLGYFVDAPVAGLSYQSASHSGTTGKNGEFEFTAAETTTFSFKGLELGSVTPTESDFIVTPLDLFNTTDVNNVSVVNALVFLQSFDADKNPTNGIYLPDYDETIDLTGLNITDSDFKEQLLASQGANLTELVDDQKAIEHFQVTLTGLNVSPELLGRWIMRDALHGDVSATYEFSDDGQVSVTEFDDCQNNDVYWSATVTSAERNCTTEQFQQTWILTDKLLEMSNSELNDNCRVFFSSKYLIEASCLFDGSELGMETIRFERDITQLSPMLVNNAYREVTGSLSFTEIDFDSDNTGHYQYHNEQGLAQTNDGDLGDFTWNVAANTLDVSGTDNAQESFSESFSLQQNIDGALKLLKADSGEGSEELVFIPDFNPQLAKSFITQSVYGVYDGMDGQCNGIYVFDASNEDKPLRKDPNTGSAYICDFASPVTLPDSMDATSYQVTEKNGAFVIERANEVEVCWPIAFRVLSDQSDYMTLACGEQNSSEMRLDIWRGL